MRTRPVDGTFVAETELEVKRAEKAKAKKKTVGRHCQISPGRTDISASNCKLGFVEHQNRASISDCTQESRAFEEGRASRLPPAHARSV
jgi:hypothetical protein